MKKVLVHEKGHFDEDKFKENIDISESGIELSTSINIDKERSFCEFRADTMSYIKKNRTKDKK